MNEALHIPSTPLPPRLMRLPEVLHLVGLGRSRLYDLEREGRFPKRVKVSDHATAWVESEVHAFIAARIAARQPAAA